MRSGQSSSPGCAISAAQTFDECPVHPDAGRCWLSTCYYNVHTIVTSRFHVFNVVYSTDIIIGNECVRYEAYCASDGPQTALEYVLGALECCRMFCDDAKGGEKGCDFMGYWVFVM